MQTILQMVFNIFHFNHLWTPKMQVIGPLECRFYIYRKAVDWLSDISSGQKVPPVICKNRIQPIKHNTDHFTNGLQHFSSITYGPPKCRSMDPQNAGHWISSWNHSQKWTGKISFILSLQWLIGSKKIPHHTNLISTQKNIQVIS